MTVRPYLPRDLLYVLLDPTARVRYIGKTKSRWLEKRLQAHIREATRAPNVRYKGARHKSCWIKSLLACGQKPMMRILFLVPRHCPWQTYERFFIASAKALGFKLTNLTVGGDGCDSKAVKEIWAREGVKEKRSARIKIRCNSLEYKKACSERLALLWKQPEFRQRMQKIYRESRATLEYKEACRLRLRRLQALPGYEQTRQRMSASAKAREARFSELRYQQRMARRNS